MDKYIELQSLYTKIYGFDESYEQSYRELLSLIDKAKHGRKAALLEMDQHHATWHLASDLVGMTLYTDLFAGSFQKLLKKVDYFLELGVNLVHLMPILKPRPGESDGGYAVEDYRQVDSRLGTLEDLVRLINAFRKNGIYLCIDYVINHVAKENEWAQKALSGDTSYQKMFIMYDDSTIPDAFNRTVPEVLPDKCPGNFTFYTQIGKYVFTSFSDFQLDLNFQNPKVFNGMVDHLLYLANLGINMIRLDAIPFMWKELGTSCRNLPPIHDLIRMIQLIKMLVCPSVALLGEAIVEPVEIVKYFGSSHRRECDVMYNANLMVDIYNAFATRDVRLLTIDTNLHSIPATGTWMNYVRCHDDIGWGFNEAAIRSFGLDPFQHKQFLIHFYNNDFPNTFSSGEYYQFNSMTQDARTNGTLASLLGLEKGVKENAVMKQRTAIDRILLANAVILAYRGFPLFYAGDEIATLNDQSYRQDPDKKNESRWIHRPFFDWKRAINRDIVGTVEYQVFQSLKKLISIRKKLPFFAGTADQKAIDVHPQVFCFIRSIRGKSLVAIFNFSEFPQWVNMEKIRSAIPYGEYIDATQGRVLSTIDSHLELSPYEFAWFRPQTR
jgi:amylosucrase